MFESEHKWLGTKHCLRKNVGIDEWECCNDHTGCIYNDGHNSCMSNELSFKIYDSPLLKGIPKNTINNRPMLTSANRVYSARYGQED